MKKAEGKEEAGSGAKVRNLKSGQKSTKIDGVRWQGFEEELDLAGAAQSAAVVSNQFADTGRPFRFQG